MDQLKEAFDRIRAEDDLRRKAKEFVEKHRRQPRTALVTATVCSCIAVCLLVGIWLYFTPTAHVSIDIDSSLELGINRFDRVVSASGSSKSAQTLVSELDLLHLDYTEAMGQIITSNTVTTLLDEGEVMDVSVIAPQGEQSSRLMTEAQACAEDHENAKCHQAEPEKVENAKSLGLSKGQYRALLELQEMDPTITADQIRDMSMRQIRELAEELHRTTENAPDPERPPEKPPAEEHGKDDGKDKGKNDGKGNGGGKGNGKKPGND